MCIVLIDLSCRCQLSTLWRAAPGIDCVYASIDDRNVDKGRLIDIEDAWHTHSTTEMPLKGQVVAKGYLDPDKDSIPQRYDYNWDLVNR